VRTYSVANTPVYLYHNYLRDDSVRELARESTPSELVALFNERLLHEPRTVEDVAVAYAVVVAATQRDYDDAMTILSQLQLTSLDWAADIVRYWDETRISTFTLTFNVPPAREGLTASSESPLISSIVNPIRPQRAESPTIAENSIVTPGENFGND
jgi:hypothetical protein